MNFKTSDELLEFAIKREDESYKFYMNLGEKTVNRAMSKLFKGFANEELNHKKILEDLQSGKELAPYEQDVMDLQISDYTVKHEGNLSEMDYQQALILAMKKEKAAFKLYFDLSERTIDDKLKNLLLGLAHEEANHKLRFEIEYDNEIYNEN